MTGTEKSDPRVYVGTYGKYNNGSLKGAWLNLADYANKEAFLAACAELHKDEHDPELMFQDHEGIPEGMIGDDGEEARRFTRARRGCGGMRTDPGAATGGGWPGSASAWGMS